MRGRANHRYDVPEALLLVLGLCIASSGCFQAQERPDFGTYPGPAAADDDAGASGGSSTGGASGVTTGGFPPGPTTGGTPGGGSTGVGSSGGVTGGSSGAVTGGTSNSGGANSGGSGSTGGVNGASSGGTGGVNGASSGSTGGVNGGSSGNSSGGTSGGTSGGGTSGGVRQLTFSVTTVALGGKYAPRNIGAIWVTTSTGTFVKTLELWAKQRLQYLTTFAAQTNRNTVDALTSATLTAHRAHMVTWDLTDVSGKVVPDGDYKIVIETTDKDAAGDSLSVPFTKGAPLTVSPPDVAHYTDMNLQLQ